MGADARLGVRQAQADGDAERGTWALHAWLDTWQGIGLIEHGMAHEARDLSLTRDRDRWGAFGVRDGQGALYRGGIGMASGAVGAVQQAAFRALHRSGYWSDQPQVLSPQK